MGTVLVPHSRLDHIGNSVHADSVSRNKTTERFGHPRANVCWKVLPEALLVMTAALYVLQRFLG